MYIMYMCISFLQARMIKETALNEIRRIDPALAIESYTHQPGQHGKHLCPFHADTHPSLTVKGSRWACWSCGESGDTIDFVRKYFGIGFREAVAKLGADFGIDTEDRPPANRAEREAALWDRIERECDRRNRQQYRQSIEDQIDTLTIVHRVLLQHGAPINLLDKYASEIDELIERR